VGQVLTVVLLLLVEVPVVAAGLVLLVVVQGVLETQWGVIRQLHSVVVAVVAGERRGVVQELVLPA
jgi:hypothetical protein